MFNIILPSSLRSQRRSFLFYVKFLYPCILLRDEVTGEWKRLHNEELNDLYCSPNIVRVIKYRRMRLARMGEERGCIGSWWRNRTERDHWGRPRRRWVDNIRLDLQEVGYGYMDWIGAGPGYRQLADGCECCNEPSGSVKCGEFLG